MLVKILRPFPCSDDGVNARQLAADTIETVRDDLVPGLIAEGYVAAHDGAIAAPMPAASFEAIRETKIIDAAPETGAPVEIEPSADPLDHDRDGRKGGSLKGRRRAKAGG